MKVTTKTTSRVLFTTRSNCRMCGSQKLTKVWSLGPTPLANAYLKPSDVGKQEEPLVPLDVYYCQNCHLVQLRDIVNPNILFDNYLYVSSTSPSFVKHFADFAAELVDRFQLTNKSLIVDIGSNDGVLLKPLQKANIRVLGVEPAENIAQLARSEGIDTRTDYFTPTSASSIAKEYGRADVITANNVFAHTDNVDDFTEATKILLKNNGVFVFEVQYLGDLLAKNLFDIVYHEHLNYYSIHPLITFFQKHEMEIFDVTRLPVHGGSLRVFVQLADGPHKQSPALDKILREEKSRSLTTLAPYTEFAARIRHNKKKLQSLLHNIKTRRKKIVGYGAPAKATTLCYVLGIDSDTIDYIVDDDKKIKQGLVMPGTHIPILPPDRLYEDNPDFCLILAWNFAEPIMKNHQRFTKQGGKFIVPVPEPKIT